MSLRFCLRARRRRAGLKGSPLLALSGLYFIRWSTHGLGHGFIPALLRSLLRRGVEVLTRAKRNARDSVKSWAFVEQPLPRKAVLADSFGGSVTFIADPELASPAGRNHRRLAHLYLPSQFGCQRRISVSYCFKATFIAERTDRKGECAKICISLPPL